MSLIESYRFQIGEYATGGVLVDLLGLRGTPIGIQAMGEYPDDDSFVVQFVRSETYGFALARVFDLSTESEVVDESDLSYVRFTLFYATGPELLWDTIGAVPVPPIPAPTQVVIDFAAETAWGYDGSGELTQPSVKARLTWVLPVWVGEVDGIRAFAGSGAEGEVGPDVTLCELIMHDINPTDYSVKAFNSGGEGPPSVVRSIAARGWQPLPNAGSENWQDLAVSAAPGATGTFVAGAASGLFVSRAVYPNWGQSWIKRAVGDFIRVAISTGGQYVFGLTSAGVVFVSNNSGETFTQIVLGVPGVDMAVSTTGRYVYILTSEPSAPFFFSTDYGVGWDVPAWTGTFDSVDCGVNPHILFFTRAGASIVYRSMDYGTTVVALPDQPVGAGVGSGKVRMGGDDVYLLANSPVGGGGNLWFSTDLGFTWGNGSPLPGEHFDHVAFGSDYGIIATDGGVMYAGSDAFLPGTDIYPQVKFSGAGEVQAVGIGYGTKPSYMAAVDGALYLWEYAWSGPGPS